MRLFLASHDFGNQADKLCQMVGPNRQTLIITNARDYVSPAEKPSVLQRKIQLFAHTPSCCVMNRSISSKNPNPSLNLCYNKTQYIIHILPTL